LFKTDNKRFWSTLQGVNETWWYLLLSFMTLNTLLHSVLSIQFVSVYFLFVYKFKVMFDTWGWNYKLWIETWWALYKGTLAQGF